jgi:hypothetical protein
VVFGVGHRRRVQHYEGKVREYSEDELDPVYRKEKTFVPSLSLEAMAKSGKFEP